MAQSHTDAQRRRERGTYRSMLYLVARAVAFPHGYTLLIWATTMITVEQRGLPTTASIFAMLVGASTAYIALGRLGVAGFSRVSARHSHIDSARADGESAGTAEVTPPRLVNQPYLVASMNFATLFLATGACAGVARIPLPLLAWFAVGITGTGVYLTGVVVQNQILERILRAYGRAQSRARSIGHEGGAQ